MKRPLRITYILPQLDIGGSETHVVRLAEQLRKRGHDVRILCIFQEGQLSDWARQLGIPLEALRQKKWRPPALLRIYHWLKKNPSDIVHTYLFGLHLFAGLSARLARVPVVVSSRRGVDLSQPAKILWLEMAGNLFSDRVVACAEAVRDWVLSRENVSPAKVVTLYNGVDLSLFSPQQSGRDIRCEFGIPEAVPLVGTVANFSDMKGYSDLIEAAALILQQRPDCQFLFVGAGPLEAEMRVKAEQLTGRGKIHFTGSRRDVPKLLAAMNIFAFASYWEGVPNVVLEAMALAKPVVSTPAGGVPEVISDGLNGRIVPMRSPQAMAEAILALMENPDESQALGVAARRTIETRFTLDRMADDYENFYTEILNRRTLLPGAL